jgi:histidinol-phosphatase
MRLDLEFAMALADRADEISGRYFASGPVTFETKPDGSPVTAADLEVEQTLQRLVANTRPGDGFLGEEVGEVGPPARRWIVDGIDGTHAFVVGRPEWGTLIALEDRGEVVVGVASSPGLRRRWWAARGVGAWTAPLGALGQAEPLRVSPIDASGARANVLPPVAELEGWRLHLGAWVANRFRSPTASGHGPFLVAGGDCELSIHLGGGPWDHAAFVVIVEEAGGRFVDLWGTRRLDTRTAVFGTPSAVEQMLRDLDEENLRPAAPKLRPEG